jgi:adenylyltransferase/sulfurtransferase
LGSPVLTYLACAGIGYLRILDGDVVEESNLNRQFLHSTPDLGAAKAENAAESLRKLNPEIGIRAMPCRVSSGNIDEVLADIDVIVDASDNHATRTLISEWASNHRVGVVWGVIYGMSGYAGTFLDGKGHAYHRLFPVPADSGTVELPAQAGVVGAACGVIGSVMAMEVIHYVARGPRTRPDRLTHYDGGAGTVALLQPSATQGSPARL